MNYDRRIRKFQENLSCRLRQFWLFWMQVLERRPGSLLFRLVSISSVAFRVFSYPWAVR